MITTRRSWSNEEGVALVLAMFMVLVVSLLGASLAGVGRTETLSSLNYKTMSQARYAAESGLHSVANFLIHTYQPPGMDPADPLMNYDMTKSPVEYAGKPVVLTTVDGVDSNYPLEAKIEDFAEDGQGQMVMATTRARFTATATLLSMRSFPDAYSGGNVTIQKWLLTGLGSIDGAGAADVQVSAVIETQAVPAYRYAAFATNDQCEALYFGGGGQTDSYDSSKNIGNNAIIDNPKFGGDVGTNGGLKVQGATSIINGKLSTPRSGVGTCGAGNIIALDGDPPDVQGMVKLPQSVKMSTPAPILPAPPLTATDFQKTGGCPANAPVECSAAGNVVTLTPVGNTPVRMGNVSMNAQAEVHLKAGIYEINSIDINGNAKLQIDSGPVVIRINGKDASNNDLATPIKINGGGIVNGPKVPMNLQFVYGGTGEVQINGNATVSLLTYAPNATVTINGGAEVYGALVGSRIRDLGGAKIHYDRQLAGWAFTEGNPTMTSFTWSSTD
jgi:hypothetical protein